MFTEGVSAWHGVLSLILDGRPFGGFEFDRTNLPSFVPFAALWLSFLRCRPRSTARHGVLPSKLPGGKTGGSDLVLGPAFGRARGTRPYKSRLASASLRLCGDPFGPATAGHGVLSPDCGRAAR